MTVQIALQSISRSSLIMFLLLLCSISFFVSSTLHAQDSKRDTLIELLELRAAMGGEQQLAKILIPYEKMISDIGEDLNIQPDEQYLVLKYKNKLFVELQSRFSWEAVRDNTLEVYESHYTESEILDILKFYNSETGRAMLQKAPYLLADFNKAIASKVEPIRPKLEKRIDNFIDKLRSAHPD